jgi:hypothetical protein
MTWTTILVIATIVILLGILGYAVVWKLRGYNHPI